MGAWARAAPILKMLTDLPDAPRVAHLADLTVLTH
jgi:hypothetical protein